MKFEKSAESVKSFIIRIGKRNLIIICAVLLVGVAAAVNWIYFAGQKKDADAAAGADSGTELSADAGSSDGADEVSSYFSAAQVSRRRARDEAMEVLQGVIDDSAADNDAREAALSDLTQMAKDMESEARIEALVTAKGFEQCVAVIGDTGVNVVVDVKEGPLNPSQIAQINTIVFEQTGFRPDQIVIIEK